MMATFITCKTSVGKHNARGGGGGHARVATMVAESFTSALPEPILMEHGAMMGRVSGWNMLSFGC